jgi:phage baseplate assembly protein W
MAFNARRIYPIDLNTNQAIGVTTTFNNGAVFNSTYFTQDAIRNNLINFLFTNPGEIYENPNFGAGLKKFIFSQIDEGNIQGIQQILQTKINTQFPQIELSSLNIYQYEDTNSLYIELNYNIPNTTISGSITGPIT